MALSYLVDFYNVFHQQWKGQSYSQQIIERALDDILMILQAKQQKARIIFDGHTIPSLSSRTQWYHISYSGNKKADDILIDLLSRPNASHKWILVTNDKEIIQSAKEHEVSYRSVNEFFTSKGKNKKRASFKASHSSDPIVSEKEVENFMKLFSLRNDFDDTD